MRIVKSLFLGIALLALVPGTANAQDKKIHFHFGGGPTFLGGDLGSVFSTGWGPAVGVTFDVNERVGLQFEYAFRWFFGRELRRYVRRHFHASHHTNQLAFNLVLTSRRAIVPHGCTEFWARLPTIVKFRSRSTWVRASSVTRGSTSAAATDHGHRR
jgi:hypothetical protein